METEECQGQEEDKDSSNTASVTLEAHAQSQTHEMTAEGLPMMHHFQRSSAQLSTGIFKTWSCLF